MRVILNNLEKEEKIDWSKVQLVVSDDERKKIVLVSLNIDSETETQFPGQELSTGIFYKSWIKSKFKPFKGSITLQND
jgi:hypothetical protein